jgi:uncharacterized protein YkwD
MMRLALALTVAAALAAAGNASGRTPATVPGAVAGSAPQAALAARGVREMPALEEQVLAAINELRHEHGLVELRLNTRLASTALVHSLSMAEQGYFQHSSLAGAPFWKRVEGKYDRRAGGLWRVGENLAWASPGLSAEGALALWLNSPRHRKNLLTPGWREIGLGAVHALAAPGVFEGRATTILTADFGVRR